VILTHCHFDVALLPTWPVSYALPARCILFAPVLFVLLLFRFHFIMVRKDFFPAELKWAGFLRPFFDLRRTTQSCIVLASSSQLSFSCSDRLSHVTTVGPCFSPQKSKSPCPADWEKGAASPSILVALLICCSGRNTAHVGHLYPASSNSSVRSVSFRVVVISACSWPSRHSCFFRKLHISLVIVHPHPGSRYLVRPSVVMTPRSRFAHSLTPYLRQVYLIDVACMTS